MDEPVVDLSNYAAGIFGYGSLISIASLERTLERTYDGPFVTCRVAGWRRSWDVAMPNPGFCAYTAAGLLVPEHILYLNVRRASGSLLNGVLFGVSRQELQAMDKREWIYDRAPVNDQLRGVRIAGGEAYIYVAKPEFIMSNIESPAVAAVRGSYLEILEAGFSDLAGSFRNEFDKTTDPVPRHLVIADRRVEQDSGLNVAP
ncbi:MAG TPA: gamma-glutamylcyclotransferase family protein [Blastocatellia bacterium]|nr:gamma-glutamylcyclotransferase family protein [Blastocatellia bacterium]